MAKESRIVDGDFSIPVHPGEMLRDMLDMSGLSQQRLAKHLGMDTTKINEICRQKRGISAEMAVALGRAFGTSAEMWLNFQKNWELSRVDTRKFAGIRRMKLVGDKAA